MNPDVGSYFAPQFFIQISGVIGLSNFEGQGDPNKDAFLGRCVDVDWNAHIIASK